MNERTVYRFMTNNGRKKTRIVGPGFFYYFTIIFSV